ncbi:MAG TPA: SusC/RagA family TonB-linked outer membrane protein, partial [Puia sp.]|nr:SusC/RagA family TonB-linked outer membrane protein [Puia sp.]
MCIFHSGALKRPLMIACALLCTAILTTAVRANGDIQPHAGRQHITVKSANISLQQAFQLIEKQTRLQFAYDEYEIDLSLKLVLKSGHISLGDLLDTISAQTGYKFTQVKNTILVSATTLALSKPEKDQFPPPVKGMVTDSSGKPLAGATVMVKGTKISVQTDLAGRFAINAPADATLVVSYVGFRTLEVAVNGQQDLIVAIREIREDLGQVVIMGYQTQRRSAIAGAVSVVNVDDVARIPVGFADQALQGQASGVRITQSTGQPGDGLALRIRGVGSVNNNDPLYIIDGVPTTDGINFLPADDIATITVLKDAASAAIYGARSSNGVVVITTKNGKSGRTSIIYSVYAGVQTHGFLTPMTNAAEYKTLYNEMVVNDNAGLAPNNPLIKIPIPDSVQMANTNWIGSIFRTAPEQDHELSVSGGNEKTQYSVSGNYFNQDGIILNSWYKRYTLHTKLTSEITDHLRIGTNLNFSYYAKNSVGSSGDGYGGNG